MPPGVLVALRIAGCTRCAGGGYTLQAEEVADIEGAIAEHLAIRLARLHGEAVVVSRNVAMEELEGRRSVGAT